MRKKLLILLIAMLLTQPVTYAQVVMEFEATPSVITEPGARLLITEVNFKNTIADWVEILYLSPSNKPLNLKGISFQDDSTFKTITTDFFLQPHQYGVLYFNNTENDTTPYLYTSRKGLTATTEQFVIFDQNHKILDALCWTSDAPTVSETKEFEAIFEEKGWHSKDITTCIKSNTIKTNQGVARETTLDTNTKEDWLLAATPTPGGTNLITLEEASSPTTEEPEETVEENNDNEATEDESEISNETYSEETISEVAPNEKSTTKAKSSKKTTPKKTKKKTTKKYLNGDLSEDIIINEFLPNPKGEDSKNEWIELYNVGENDINLGNWQLDDEEGGSKAFILSDETIIKAGATLVIPSKESKLALGNKKDEIRLSDFEDTIINEITYEEAPSGESYGLISITRSQNLDDPMEESTWQWLKNPTPNAANPSYEEIIVTIAKEPDFKGDYSFEIQDEQNLSKTIIFGEDIIPGPLAKATFTKGTKVKLLLSSNSDDTYQLQGYEVLEPTKVTNFTMDTIFSILGTIASLGIIVYIMRRKIFTWYHHKAKKDLP